MEMYYCDLDLRPRDYSRISPENLCGQFGLSNGNVRFFARVGPEKNSEYRKSWQSVHARWPASIESLGPSIAWPFLQEQWRIINIKDNCSDVGILLCPLDHRPPCGSGCTLLRGNISRLRARDMAARCRKQEA